VEASPLRVIDPKVIAAVDARLDARRAAYLRDTKGRLLGRPRGTGTGRLLTGFLQCACGARFEAVKGYYVCAARRRKGPDVCPSDLSFPVDAIEPVFLDTLERVVFSQRFVDHIVNAVVEARPDVARDSLMRERERLAAEITNLTAAIAVGGDIPALVAELQKRDARLAVLDKQLAQPVDTPGRDVLRAALELRAGQWRDILRSRKYVAQARTVLQHLIELPLKISNEPKPKWMTKTRPASWWEYITWRP